MIKKTISVMLVLIMLVGLMSINLSVAAITVQNTPYVAAGGITVDGVLDAGKYGTEIVMVRANDNWTLGGTDPGTTASLYTAWSDGKLYFFYDVKTTKNPLMTGAAAYLSDAIDLYITGPGADNQVSLFAGTGALIYNITGTLAGRKVTPGVGYTVELEIPWINLQAGGSIAFAAVVNDNYKKLGTKNYTNEWSETSTYDSLMFAANPNPGTSPTAGATATPTSKPTIIPTATPIPADEVEPTVFARKTFSFLQTGSNITVDGVKDSAYNSSKAVKFWQVFGVKTDPLNQEVKANIYGVWKKGAAYFFFEVKDAHVFNISETVTPGAEYSVESIDINLSIDEKYLIPDASTMVLRIFPNNFKAQEFNIPAGSSYTAKGKKTATGYNIEVCVQYSGISANKKMAMGMAVNNSNGTAEGLLGKFGTNKTDGLEYSNGALFDTLLFSPVEGAPQNGDSSPANFVIIMVLLCTAGMVFFKSRKKMIVNL